MLNQRKENHFEKTLYFIFVSSTFIMLTISLTIPCWIDGEHLLHSESTRLPGTKLYTMYFIILLLGNLFVILAALLLTISFYIKNPFHHRSTLTASICCMASALIICLIVSTSVPIHAKEPFINLGYGYFLLLGSIVTSLSSIIVSMKLVVYQQRNPPYFSQNEKSGDIAYIYQP